MSSLQGQSSELHARTLGVVYGGKENTFISYFSGTCVALFEEHECTSLTLTKKGKKNLYTTLAHIFDFLVFVQSLV